jgi:phosphoribosylformylglycinamidine synthase PurS subunit
MTAFTATVTVRLKSGVLDPEAETTQRALERLGFEVEDLRFADRFEIDLDAAGADAAAERATEMAERLLANPTIHDYTVEVAAAATDGGRDAPGSDESAAGEAA